MLRSKANILALLMMLLVFTGQTVSASALSCPMNSTHHNISAAKSNLNTDAPCMDNMNQDASCPVPVAIPAEHSDLSSCCDQDCVCPVGDLSSALLTTTPENDLDAPPLQQYRVRSFSIVRNFPKTLYRPPIFG
ncbi:hypothetical protein [Paremcibacter congregatus]|uniref:Uncharacterized protein n=1 Tax=Paremcibacter congregatus TaxID=2043170 RepID=A0A2G4YTW0_9PROT|nr:hypothetical protein [Paremcibacter congregatus]PHZ85774.1 hypothetical protein CRD36_03585 [Paremcibacter congregatus]QDE26735.1 hypothetical protein FIV45_05350 [Paremcibacter congregatus]